MLSHVTIFCSRDIIELYSLSIKWSLLLFFFVFFGSAPEGEEKGTGAHREGLQEVVMRITGG